MYCSQCGKEIPDNSKFCKECGCPIPNKTAQQSTGKKSVQKASTKNRTAHKKIKSWQLALILVGIVLLLLFIVFLILGARVSSEIKETKDNITPYLDYIGKYAPDGEYLDIDDDLNEKKEDVFFMGMKGRITFIAKDNYINKCTWKSDEEFTEEDYQKKIDDLYVYFGEKPTYTTLSYNANNTYIYYWTDANNGFSVTCSRDFFGYYSPGYLEINWEAADDVLEEIKEAPESIIEETDEEERAETDDYDKSKDADSEIGVVENIHTTADIPNTLMNDKFKNVIDLFSKGFSKSGLDISNATKTDAGTYIFYFDDLEFLGDKCEENDSLCPRVIYDQDAINNNGTPYEMCFAFANPLKSNGYNETVEMIEDIAKALGISNSGLIDNDYSSSSKLATGEYATFTFPNLNLKLTVSNTDGTVEIEIIPID